MANKKITAATLIFPYKLENISDPQEASKYAQELQKVLGKLQLPKTLQTNLNKSISNLQRDATKASEALASGFKNKGDVTKYSNALDSMTVHFRQIRDNVKQIDLSKFEFVPNTQEYHDLDKAIKQIKMDLEQLRLDNLEKIKDISDRPPTSAKAWGEFFNAFKEGDIEQAEKALSRLQTQLTKAVTKAGGEDKLTGNWKTYAEDVHIYEQAMGLLKGELVEVADKLQALDDLARQKAGLELEEVRAGAENLQRMKESTDQASRELDGLVDKEKGGARATQELNGELEQFGSRIKYFFGLSNAVHLFQRAIRAAFETVKDLDKVMTETAVVTEFDVGDMWSQLPEYTERANKLGVTIHDAYESATLYYQQGLKTNEVVAVSNETLKMARIAGLDAADATDRMTNALRGFNMAITEANAQNVNDVYSNLAAITASNVDEISTAMTKVASLASNANMSFENTAAFLSQIIETTRESAETAGTALKTVIARFSEVKNLYSEGQLTGTDEEGETIDVNKVSKALRSAGINLNEYFTGAKGLDQVFMELSSKWANMDQVQQRYIATMAAGSRQQSRFIALMQDYGRMQQLVTEANNSAGASQQQYEKTLESLETKLNKLKNAWDEFVMGLANDDLFKGAIDLLTELIQGVNKLTELLPGLGGSFAKVGIIAGGLKGGSVLGKNLMKQIGESMRGEAPTEANKTTKTLLGSLKTAFSPLSSVRKQGFGAAFKKAFTGTDMVVDQDATAALQKQNFMASINQQISEKVKGNTRARSIGQQVSGGAYHPDKGELAQTFEIIYETKGQEAAIAAAQKVGFELQGTDEIVQSNAISYESLSQSMMGIGQAGLGVTAILGGITAILGKTRGESDKATQVFGSLTGTVGGLSTALMMIPPLCKAVGISIEAIPIIGWVAAGIAAIIEIIQLIDIFTETSDEKLERVSSNLQDATKTASDAADAYDNLSSSLTELSGKYDALDGLTQGTLEYSAAVREANAEVLDLITKYPALSGLTTSKDGVLRLDVDSEEVKGVLTEVNQAAISAQGAQVLSQIELMQAQAEAAREQIDELDYRFSPTDGWGGLPTERQTVELDEKIAKVMEKAAMAFAGGEGAESIAGQTKEEYLKSLARAFGLDVQIDSELIDSLESWGKELLDSETELKSFATAVNLAAKQTIDTTKYTKEQNKILDNLYSAEYLDKLKAAKGAQFAGSYGGWSSADQDKYIEYWKSIYGMDTIVSSTGEVTTADGRTITKESATAQYIDKIVMDAVSEGMKNASKEIEQMSVQQQKYVAAVSSGDFGGLSYADLNDFNAEEAATTYAKLLGYEEDQLEDFAIQMGAASFNAYVQGLKNQSGAVKDDLDNIFKKGLQGLDTLFESTDVDTIKKLDEQAKIYGQAYVKSLNEVLSKAGKDKDLLASIFANTDWSNASDAMGAYETMLEQGLSEETAKKYWQQATDSANLYFRSIEEVLDLTEQFQNKMKSATDIQTRLVEGKATAEDLKELVKYGVDVSNFEVTSEGWKSTAEEAYNAAQIMSKGISDSFKESADAAEKTKEDFIKLQQRIETYGYTTGRAAAFFGLTKEKGESDDEFAKRVKEVYDKYLADLQSGIVDAEIELARKTGELFETAPLEVQVDLEGFDKDTVEAYANELMRVNKELDKLQATQLAVRQMKLDRAVKDLIDSAEKWKKLIQSDGGFGKILNTEDIEVFAKFKKSAQEMIGIEGEISDEFFKSAKNINLIQSAINGSDKALHELQKNAAIDIITNFKGKTGENLTEAFKQELTTAINEIYNIEELSSLEIGVKANFDTKNFSLETYRMIQGLMNLMNQAQFTSSQVQEAFKAMGYDVVVTKQDSFIEVPTTRPMPGNPSETITTTRRVKQTVNALKIITKGGNFGGTITSPVTDTPSGGGSGSDKKETWKNPYDELYNLNERINDEIRKRERLERKYQLSIENSNSTVKEVRDNYRAQLDIIQAQIKSQKELQAGRKKQIQNLGSMTYTDDKGTTKTFKEWGVTKYASYDFASGKFRIDWSGLQELQRKSEKGSEQAALLGKIAEEFINLNHTLVDQYEETRDAIWQLEDDAKELSESIRDSYLSFEDRVKEAYINSRQQTIDDLQSLSDTISESNNRVLESLREQIDLERQIRDNTKTEQDIADKEARLAYLQRDTSGANQLEILKLQKEIDQARENYTDSLVDQSIDRLQKDNENMEKQRQMQIELMQKQLEIDEEQGAIWEDIKDLMATAFGPDGTVSMTSELMEILKDTEKFLSMSEAGQEKWREELFEMIKSGFEAFNDAGKYVGVPVGTKKYASGGLATTTGPAWLDGTRSKPEMVLSAEDTQNFIQLKNILASLFSNTMSRAQAGGGDNYFDINISVDELANDYDVDKMADRIKQLIYNDSTYRNVNMINFIR